MSTKLPEGWKEVELQELVDNTVPYPIGDGDHGQINPKMYVDKGVPYIRVQNLSDGKKLIKKNLVFIPEEVHKVNLKSELRPGDVLIGKTGSIGKSCLLDESFTKANTTSSVGKITVDKNKLLPEFLIYYFRTSMFKNQMYRVSKKTSQPGFNIKDLKKFKIMLPPIAEQRKIISLLEKAEQIKNWRKEADDLSKDYLKSVFVDMFGDPILNSKKWDVNYLKDLSILISSGNTPKGGSKVYTKEGITFFRSQNVWKNEIRYKNVAYIDQEIHNSMKNTSLKHKDILMTKTGRINTENSSLGRAAIYLGEDDGANINGHVYLIRLKETTIPEFVLFILTTNEYREYIRSVCVGGIDKRQINKIHLEKFPIIMPPHELQKKFCKLIKSIQIIQENQKLLHKESSNLFNSLMQKAFKGEIKC